MRHDRQQAGLGGSRLPPLSGRGIEELAASVVQVPFFGAEVWLVPGVMGPAAANVPELMRGEETAAMGMLDAAAARDWYVSRDTFQVDII